MSVSWLLIGVLTIDGIEDGPSFADVYAARRSRDGPINVIPV